MAQPRSQLQDHLKAITPNVYFQPPNKMTLKYPCIIYARETVDASYADNLRYRDAKKYSVTVIDRDPDSQLPDRVSKLPLCSHNRFFTADDLNHDVFTLYH